MYIDYNNMLYDFDNDLFKESSNDSRLVKIADSLEHQIKINVWTLPTILNDSQIQHFFNWAHNGWDGKIPSITNPPKHF